MTDLNKAARELIAEQVKNWGTARESYKGLAQVKVRTVDFGTFRMGIELNPGRVRSNTAKTDDRSISGRKCFLCPENRPPEQKGIVYGNYDLLINPYPVFRDHLILSHHGHRRQVITGRWADLVRAAGDLTEYTLFFNGAQSGASAPDYLHFQAIPQGLLPMEADAEHWSDTEMLLDTAGVKVRTLENYLRPVVVIEAKDGAAAAAMAERITTLLPRREGEELRMNDFVRYHRGSYHVYIILREEHRPWEYFAPEPDKLLFSPGAIDMAGWAVTVREEDFRKLGKELLTEVFRQVVPDAHAWNQIKKNLKLCLSGNR